ncbi:putative Thiol peroxidase [Blattamonas nauphoetae]|uniref:Thiol peroxidase n=1 Tax=Blattamonas nauphoetae TaxID=2049346 RepID=A0ABQ9YBZ8_9EUKA|nr:putative Thiol peroxidase [Blattamonas nauphoetae]
MTSVDFLGTPMTTSTPTLKVGDAVPAFTLQRANDLSAVQSTDILKAGPTVFSTFPSIDTPICSRQTHEFTSSALLKDKGINLVNVSMDLPFALQRHAKEVGCQREESLFSDHLDANFSTKFGVLLAGPRLLARAVFLTDKQGKIAYVQVCPKVGEEPNYKDLYAAIEKL